ncbi:MAG: DegT/DnrJ/EryC1/StrS family aminotransferase [Thermodesulfobacteriota bacterium]
MPVPFNDLKAQLAPLEPELREAFERVLGRGWFLAGPEVAAFEAEFAAWLGLPHAVALNSGTDALSLALRALDLAPGDEVVLPAHTAPPCYHAVLAAGCAPVFADVDPDHGLLDPAAAAAVVGPRTRALMAVHLYGLPCDLDPLLALCADRSLALVEDCAQAHGAAYRGRKVGTFGRLAAFSFYPTKNLGALGDAGATACTDPALAERLAMLRQYGERTRYDCELAGANSRMDELQAAFLRARLGRLAADTAARRELAAAYAAGLDGLPLVLPAEPQGREHVHHLYVVRTPQRDALATHLKERGIGSAVHYPVPGHRQPLFTSGKAGFRAGNLANTERLCREILSLPFYPGMGQGAVEEVCAAVRSFFA